ncbi:MAG: hypothetical protein K0R77_1200 [Chryseobacterium sp.]|jgi:hypothetical protein|uniref:hypothetical protein n=1 Tax=Chryseobacterium sp. TaxID=1871047 RepID=UPI00261238DF|nr:hypothetical protein [Chryseobacterium sp.]MDF2551925.1 hypothetical protein [Chryseobacterium sp.]
MTYKYSICFPNKEKIEYKDEVISANDVLIIARNHPWREHLVFTENSDISSIYYNPSLDFTCIENGKSFGLTADFNKNKEVEFSLWYKRPKKIKILFGLLGEIEKKIVDNKWEFDLESSLNYLRYFVSGNYLILEELFKK